MGLMLHEGWRLWHLPGKRGLGSGIIEEFNTKGFEAHEFGSHEFGALAPSSLRQH